MTIVAEHLLYGVFLTGCFRQLSMKPFSANVHNIEAISDLKYQNAEKKPMESVTFSEETGQLQGTLIKTTLVCRSIFPIFQHF